MLYEKEYNEPTVLSSAFNIQYQDIARTWNEQLPRLTKSFEELIRQSAPRTIYSIEN